MDKPLKRQVSIPRPYTIPETPKQDPKPKLADRVDPTPSCSMLLLHERLAPSKPRQKVTSEGTITWSGFLKSSFKVAEASILVSQSLSANSNETTPNWHGAFRCQANLAETTDSASNYQDLPKSITPPPPPAEKPINPEPLNPKPLNH